MPLNSLKASSETCRVFRREHGSTLEGRNKFATSWNFEGTAKEQDEKVSRSPFLYVIDNRYVKHDEVLGMKY